MSSKEVSIMRKLKATLWKFGLTPGLLLLYLGAGVTRINAMERPVAAVMVPSEDHLDPLAQELPSFGAPIRTADRRFTKSMLAGGAIIASGSRAGIAETVITCDVLMLKFRAPRLISLGVAGGLSEDYKVGDVVIVHQVGCYDRGTYGEDGAFIPKETALDNVHSDEKLEKFLAEFIDGARAAGLRVHENGRLVSGDGFIASETKRRELVKRHGANLVDMNSEGIRETCRAFGTPYCIIRVVSDYANASANSDFMAFVEDDEYFLSLFQVLAAALKTSWEEPLE